MPKNLFWDDGGVSLLLIALAAWNAVVFCLYAFDKHRARKGGRRIRERTLLLSAALMGAAGALAAMLLCRHKTRHRSFTLTVPLFLALQCAALIYLFTKF